MRCRKLGETVGEIPKRGTARHRKQAKGGGGNPSPGIKAIQK